MRSTVNPPTTNEENLWFHNDLVFNHANVKIPTPTVLKMLLTLITSDIVRHPSNKSVPLLPYSDFVASLGKFSQLDVIKLINEFPRHLTQRYINHSIVTSGMLGVGAQYRDIDKAQFFLADVCLAYGNDIIEASDDLEIPGFSIGVKQFILAKPKRHFHSEAWLRKKVELLKLKRKSKVDSHRPYNPLVSTLLCHGTEMSHFQSILRKDFTRAADHRIGRGLFMAEDPEISWRYARERMGRNNPTPLSPFLESPYKGCSVY